MESRGPQDHWAQLLGDCCAEGPGDCYAEGCNILWRASLGQYSCRAGLAAIIAVDSRGLEDPWAQFLGDCCAEDCDVFWRTPQGLAVVHCIAF